MTETVVIWGTELQQVFYTPTLELITMFALCWINNMDELERMQSLTEKLYPTIPTQ